MLNSIRVVLFDVGGVLVELTGVSTLIGWMEYRLTPDELWRMWLSSNAVRSFETGRIGPDTFADKIIAELDLPVNRQEFLTTFKAWPKGVFPGVLDVVRRIPQQYVRAILCNTNVLHWPRFMEEMGLKNLFNFHFASHIIGKIKPDHEVFEFVVEALACEPSSILFLDDQPLNVKAAKDIGLQSSCVINVQEVENVLLEAGIIRSI